MRGPLGGLGGSPVWAEEYVAEREVSVVGRDSARTVAGRLAAALLVVVVGALGSLGAAGAVADEGRAADAAADQPLVTPLWSADPAARPCVARSVGAEVRRCRYASFDARATLRRFVTPRNLAHARDWPVVTALWSATDNRMVPGSQVDPDGAVGVPAAMNLALFDGTVVPVRTGQISTQRIDGQIEVRWTGGVWRYGQQIAVTELRFLVRGNDVQASADIAVDGSHYRLRPAGSAYRLDELDPQVWARPQGAAGSMGSAPLGTAIGAPDRQVIKVTVPGSVTTNPPATPTPASATTPATTSTGPPTSNPNPSDSAQPTPVPSTIPTPRPGRTPTTGSDAAGMALTGFGLIASGATLLVLARRKRASSPSA